MFLQYIVSLLSCVSIVTLVYAVVHVMLEPFFSSSAICHPHNPLPCGGGYGEPTEKLSLGK